MVDKTPCFREGAKHFVQKHRFLPKGPTCVEEAKLFRGCPIRKEG